MMSLSPAWEESHGRRGLGRSWRRARGFRLCPRNRFLIRRLRAKMFTFLGLVDRHARRLARRFAPSTGAGVRSRSSSARPLVGTNGSQKWCPGGDAANKPPRRAASFMRTNSFYAQAISDCLEFIKRNSVPLEDYGSPVAGAGGSQR